MRLRMVWFIILMAVSGRWGLNSSLGQKSSLKPLQEQMNRSARTGADWLYRANQSDGRFVFGYVPSLNSLLEGDRYLCQAGAAFALARAARFTGEERYAARARQALLLLLADTALDPPGVRSTVLPPVIVDRLAAAGLLVAAIHELPNPALDLLEQAEQLCAYIRSCQQSDGSLGAAESAAGDDCDPDGPLGAAGQALYGLMRSQKLKPAPWKSTAARQALAYYRPRWQAHKTMATVPWQTAAFTEAYLATGDHAFAELVYEMSDWICELQYPPLDGNHPWWGGGFKGWENGKPVAETPGIRAAAYAEGLAEACRAARKDVALPRYQRYREALESSLQFLAGLQYTDANTQHFSSDYRPALVGAFHASHQDGKIRLDYVQHALSAMVQYLVSGEW